MTWRTIVATIAACAGVAVAQEQPADPPTEPPPPPPPETWLDGWTGAIEFGLSGASGNTERLSLRGGVTGVRKVEDYETDFFLTHAYAIENGNNTENKTTGQLKNQWLFGADSPWRFFAQGRLENDRFQDWEYRLSGYAGPAYELFEDEKTTLVVRGGLGVSREFKGADEDWHPEALLGADLTHQFTERQKAYASVDVFPSLDEGGEFRAIARAGWELLVDPEVNMNFRVGVETEYDSEVPPGTRHGDVDYFALLVWDW